MKPIVSLVVAMLVIAVFTIAPTAIAADQTKAIKISATQAVGNEMFAKLDRGTRETTLSLCLSGQRSDFGKKMLPHLRAIVEKRQKDECERYGLAYVPPRTT